MAVIGKKEGKTKNVTHAVWSGLACQRAKILRKNEKCHACHMVWPWPSSAKKKEKQKKATHAKRSGRDCHQGKKTKNKKFHAQNMVLP
jgi:hypothetical protein